MGPDFLITFLLLKCDDLAAGFTFFFSRKNILTELPKTDDFRITSY